METTLEFDADLAYLRKKAAVSSGRQLGKTLATIAHLEDAIKIYHLASPPREGKYHNIPASLLVQTFMRELQDACFLRTM